MQASTFRAQNRAELVPYPFCNRLPQTWCLTNGNLLFCSFKGQKSQTSLARLKLRCRQNCRPSEGTKGQSVPLPLQRLELHSLHSLAQSLFLLLQSQGCTSLSNPASLSISPMATFSSVSDSAVSLLLVHSDCT